MSVRIEKRFDPSSHREIVTLTDSLGSQQVLSLPLVLTVEIEGQPGKYEHKKADLDKEIQAAKRHMEEREQLVIEYARERGHAIPDAKEADADCGCNNQVAPSQS